MYRQESLDGLEEFGPSDSRLLEKIDKLLGRLRQSLLEQPFFVHGGSSGKQLISGSILTRFTRTAMIPSRHKMPVAGQAACRGRRTGNPVQIRNGPAAVIEC